MKQLSGKVAVVTGAAMGMGKALSEMLLKEGCKVALVDINENLLKQTSEALLTLGECKSYNCDISDAKAVYQLETDIKNEMGTASILINNAGIVIAKELMDLDDDLIKKTINVNLLAQFWTSKAFLPGMIAQNSGHIVNFASAGGILAIPNLSAYCASKFGVMGFTESIRQEMKKKKHNIELTVVCPNTVNTGMFEGAKMVKGTRMLTTENVCRQVIKGIKANRSMVAVPSVPVKIVTPLMKTLLPIRAMDWLNATLGMWDANDSWQGRKASK